MNSLRALQAENGLQHQLWLVALDEAYAAKDADRRLNELIGLPEHAVVEVYFEYHPEMKRWANDHISTGTYKVAIYELRVELVHVGAKRRAQRRVHDGPRPTPVAPNPTLDWMKPFQSGPAKIKTPPGPDPLSGDFFPGREWCFADPAIDYIAAVDKSMRAQACHRLHLILQEGRLRARGPLPSELVEVQDIDPEFWRHASPREEGGAVGLGSDGYIAWFEVNVSDLCAAFPANMALVLIADAPEQKPPAVEPQAGEPSTTAQETLRPIPARRGPDGVKRKEATRAMIQAVEAKKISTDELQRMKQKNLVEFNPGAKRTMLAEARKDALRQLTLSKTPT
jgi:hypothetical protein